MNKLGAAILLAAAACAVPAHAQDASKKADPQNQPCFCESDITGAIGNGAEPQATAAPTGAIRPGSSSSLEPSYEEAYRNWRYCAATHQGVGNPPPQCEELRHALRRAIQTRPRSEASK